MSLKKYQQYIKKSKRQTLLDIYQCTSWALLAINFALPCLFDINLLLLSLIMLIMIPISMWDKRDQMRSVGYVLILTVFALGTIFFFSVYISSYLWIAFTIEVIYFFVYLTASKMFKG